MSKDGRDRGFQFPNTTPVPDRLFDELLTELGNAELRVLLYIIRRTMGFRKERDPISYSQFLTGITKKDGTVLDRGCGLKSATNLSKALESLEKKGLIVSFKSDPDAKEKHTTEYTLHIQEGVLTESEYSPDGESAPVLTQQQTQKTEYKKQSNKSRYIPKNGYDPSARAEEIRRSAEQSPGWVADTTGDTR